MVNKHFSIEIKLLDNEILVLHYVQLNLTSIFSREMSVKATCRLTRLSKKYFFFVNYEKKMLQKR